MVMKWLVPESSGRYVNRMTNEALHKGGPCDPMTVGQRSLSQCQARPKAGADSCVAEWMSALAMLVDAMELGCGEGSPARPSPGPWQVWHLGTPSLSFIHSAYIYWVATGGRQR